MHCFWCHNPEGLRSKIEVAYDANRCIACGECVYICEQDAHAILGGVHTYDRQRCQTCGKCIAECASEALQLSGREMTVAQVMEEVRADTAFYGNSGGGITISGGEPLLQAEFTEAILTICQEEVIHTAIETSAYYPWGKLARLLPLIDLVMMDIKHMDDAKHRLATGVSNQRILDNAKKLTLSNKPLLIHTPVVPGVNDDPQDIADIAKFVRGMIEIRDQAYPDQAGPISLVLLPFHRLAGDKYRSLGMDYLASSLQMPTKEKMIELNNVVANQMGMLKPSSFDVSL